jgi:hypothetical protein
MIRRCDYYYCDVFFFFASLFIVHMSLPLLSFCRYRTLRSFMVLFYPFILLVGRLSLFLSPATSNSIAIATKYGICQCPLFLYSLCASLLTERWKMRDFSYSHIFC